MPGFGLKSEVITLTTAGTAYPLSTNSDGYLPSSARIYTDPSNTGSIFVGGSDVTSSNGVLISASVPFVVGPNDQSGSYQEYLKSAIFIVGSQSGDKVRIIYPVRDSSAV